MRGSETFTLTPEHKSDPGERSRVETVCYESYLYVFFLLI